MVDGMGRVEKIKALGIFFEISTDGAFSYKIGIPKQ